jgi:hypothetical protein
VSEEVFKCGCQTGYREVITGDLKAYAANSHGVALEIAIDPVGTMWVGCDRDEAWAKANVGKHLVITITQFPNGGDRVIDIGLLEGRTSDLAKKAARVGFALGIEIRRGSDGSWHGHLPKGHEMIERLGGARAIPLTEEAIEAVAAKIEQAKRDPERDKGEV